MKSLKEIREVKEREEKEWLKLNEVVGVDIGSKLVKRSRTDHLSIRVLVNCKREKWEEHKVPEGHLIPQTVDGEKIFCFETTMSPPSVEALRSGFEGNGISLSSEIEVKPEKGDRWSIEDNISGQVYSISKKDGKFVCCDAVRTDVIQREFTPFKWMSENDEPDDPGKELPELKVKGGIGMDTGTLGAVVKSRSSGEPMFLTCSHNVDNKGERSLPYMGHYGIEIHGEPIIRRYEKTGIHAKTGLDCAVVRLTDNGKPVEKYTSEIIGIGRIRGTAIARRGMEVRKYGQRTGLTYGMVDSVFLTLKVDGYVYPNQIGIVPDLTRNWEFGDNGDSGSVIVNNALNAIGLLVARGMDGKYCAATPIQAVLDELDVDIYEEELSGFDKDIDDFMRSLIMPPPPLTGDIRRLLYGELVNGCCCDRS